MPRALSINIYEYLDYRAFLRDAYANLKERQRGFSYRWFAQRAGMSSPNFLKLVIDGKRNLTSQSAEQFATALGLNSQESAFLRELVLFEHASTAAEKNEHFERIGGFRKHRSVRKLERGAFEYLSRWYYPAIRELVACERFREDPAWIAKQLRPNITTSQAKRALKVLVELGMLERDEDGVLSQGEPLLSTGPEVRSLAVGNFHRQMMQRAAESIETIDRTKREVSGTTVALTPEGFEMFKAKIHQLRADLLELSAEQVGPTRVVQFNFQAFPLAEIEDDEA